MQNFLEMASAFTNLICGQEIVYGYANNIQLENRKNTTGYALEKENTYGTV